jgi:hypothetical protein
MGALEAVSGPVTVSGHDSGPPLRLRIGRKRVPIPLLGKWDEEEAEPHFREKRLAAAGSHFVVDGIAELSTVLDEIDRRLARGETP